MYDEKIEGLLSLAMEQTPSERLNNPDFAETKNDLVEVIVKYSGGLASLRQANPNWNILELLSEYAIIKLPITEVDLLASDPGIIYIELSKHLYFEVEQGRSASCMTAVQTDPTRPASNTNLNGEGVLVAILDSGIDFTHPDFRNEDGSTRILVLWDQTAVPITDRNAFDDNALFATYTSQFGGRIYSREQINEALSSDPSLVPEFDRSGHGTHVAGIAAGNGAASGGRNRGVAYRSELVIVKLGSPSASDFPRTTQLMSAVDFSIRYALSIGRPIAINISIGNNYGSHSGTSLLETYLSSAGNIWKNSIVVGSGNEAAQRIHTSGKLKTGPEIVELAVASYEPGFAIQLWKNYVDTFTIELQTPTNTPPIRLPVVPGIHRIRTGSANLRVFFGEPSPYQPFQEIFLELLPADGNLYLPSGIWTFTLIPESIKDGTYDFWLPAGGIISPATGFLQPTPSTTLTIPSTAENVISVGAYDSRSNTPASFSGRGFTWQYDQAKPDLVAPGVNILSCAPGGLYTTRTGTSMAAPFVTGSAALLMQWGILLGNDPYLYGNKIKAYLWKGARPLPAQSVYPNPQLGWGALCLADSFPNLTL